MLVVYLHQFGAGRSAVQGIKFPQVLSATRYTGSETCASLKSAAAIPSPRLVPSSVAAGAFLTASHNFRVSTPVWSGRVSADDEAS